MVRSLFHSSAMDKELRLHLDFFVGNDLLVRGLTFFMS